MKNIMFVLSVAVLTFNYMATTSTGGSLQFDPKLSHPASAPSSARLSSPEKFDTDDSSSLFHKRTSDFFGALG